MIENFGSQLYDLAVVIYHTGAHFKVSMLVNEHWYHYNSYRGAMLQPISSPDVEHNVIGVIYVKQS